MIQKSWYTLAAWSLISLSATSAAAESEPESSELEIEPYGSLRLQFQYARVDEGERSLNSYTGFQDSYSRLGVRANYEVHSNFKLSVKVETSVNSPEFRVEDPAYFDNNPLRVAKITAAGSWGSVWIGKDWLPFYNAISAYSDTFNAFQSGYSTNAYFREELLAYETPEVGGFKAVGAYIRRTTGGFTGFQGSLSYSVGGLILSAAFEKMRNRNAPSPETQGFVVSYGTGPWNFSAKYEKDDDDDSIRTLYADHTHGKLIYKAQITDGDLFGAPHRTVHVGLEYQHNEPLMLFAELFFERNNYAILFEHPKSSNDFLGAGGYGGEQNGRALIFGFRYDF